MRPQWECEPEDCDEASYGKPGRALDSEQSRELDDDDRGECATEAPAGREQGHHQSAALVHGGSDKCSRGGVEKGCADSRNDHEEEKLLEPPDAADEGHCNHREDRTDDNQQRSLRTVDEVAEPRLHQGIQHDPHGT